MFIYVWLYCVSMIKNQVMFSFNQMKPNSVLFTLLIQSIISNNYIECNFKAALLQVYGGIVNVFVIFLSLNILDYNIIGTELFSFMPNSWLNSLSVNEKSAR